jgi:hypothetical protein
MIDDREQYKKQCIDCGVDIYWKHPKYRRCLACHKKHRKDVEQPMPIINLDSKRIGAGDRPGTHPENGRRQLSEEVRAKIAYLLATLTPITEIKKCLEKETGLKINYGVIGSIRDSEKWGVVIKQLRKEWLSKVAEVPIANKRYRLEKYQKILEKCLDDDDFKQATTVLRNAKDEMEQHDIKQGSNFYSLTYINDLSDQDLMRKRDEILKRLKSSRVDLVEAANMKEKIDNKDIIDIEPSDITESGELNG